MLLVPSLLAGAGSYGLGKGGENQSRYRAGCWASFGAGERRRWRLRVCSLLWGRLLWLFLRRRGVLRSRRERRWRRLRRIVSRTGGS